MKLVIYGDIGGSGGYFRYCKGLLSSGQIPKDIEVYFITSIAFHRRLGILDNNVTVIAHTWIDSPLKIKRYLWHLWIYPRIIRKLKPDLEFYANGQLRVYLRKALTVATCHNLLLFDDFEINRIEDKKERKYFLNSKKRQIKSFSKSDALIFLSSHSKSIILPNIKPTKKNVIIDHGLDVDFVSRHERSYDLSHKINILYVSPIFHYKNHLNVVKAIQEIRNNNNFELQLSIVGGANSSAYNELKKYISINGLNDFITFKQFIDTNGLIAEFNSADLFVFASSSETFGITLLEAMGAKLPIACSNRTGLPDILKDGGVYFDPYDVRSIAMALVTLLENQNEREYLAKIAFDYSREFTWEKCSKQTFNFLRQVYKDSDKNLLK